MMEIYKETENKGFMSPTITEKSLPNIFNILW